MVKQGREWSPRGPAEVWMVLWWGDWGVSLELYGNEDLAWKSAEEFMKHRLPKMRDPEFSLIKEALELGDIATAFNIFTEYNTPMGNRIEVDRVKVRQ